MNANKRLRVVFHSKEDLSSGYNLKKAEGVLEHLKFEQDFSVNDLLELYNIKLYFDHDLFLLTWDESKKECFKQLANQGFSVTRTFYLSICSENILDFISSLDLQYRKSFWDLINSFQTFKRIEKRTFSSILEAYPHHINYLLNCKGIVNYFNSEIRDFLLQYDKAAELLLSTFEEDHRHKNPSYNFPSSLSLADKEEIISKYLDGEQPNLNFVRLIENSKTTNDLKLSPRTRLKAKRKSEELNDDILKGPHVWNLGTEVSISMDQLEPVVWSHEENISTYSYSKAYLDKQGRDADLFHLFYALFGYTDSEGLITLVSKKSERDVFEDLFMRSKNEYPAGIVFQRKAHLSDAQLHLFSYYLKQRGSSLEKIIVPFITNYLLEKFDLQNLRFHVPSEHSSYLEKIRVLAPEFEFLLKQYHNLASEGQIDFDLLTLSSAPLNLDEVCSLNRRKYIYSESEKVRVVTHHFFSDQSSLYYVEPFTDRYDNLYDLLTSEQVTMSHFEEYQKEVIQHLAGEGYLLIDREGGVNIADDIFMYVIRELNRNGVINYWHYPMQIRDVMDKMINENLLTYKDTLFAVQEVEYFNYYLNKKKFTNGFDLRNKYMHGTNTSLEKEHERDYYALLKLIILALLKIEDDLIIQKFVRRNDAS